MPANSRRWLSPRQSAGLRGSAYLAGAVSIVQGGGWLLERAAITDPLLVQGTMFGVGTAWTYTLLRLEGRPLSDLPIAERRDQAIHGAVLGAGAFLIAAAIAGARGWLGVGKWGWEQAERKALAASIVKLGLIHAAVAWNEELVFRGYGYDALREAIGDWAAGVVLTALFAAYHPWKAQALIGEATLGSTLLALRLQSGDIWLPLGYHWGWNVIQTAILGPEDGQPSLLRLSVRGPYRWVGRPGHPEPGLLMAAVNLLIALAFGFRRRRGRQ